MVRYHNFDIVFAEIPDETTLAINITNCPNRCPGCHSPHLQRDGGERLDAETLQRLLDRYGRSVTCVCFMGGDAAPPEPGWPKRSAGTVRRCAPRGTRDANASPRGSISPGSTTSSWAPGSRRSVR